MLHYEVSYEVVDRITKCCSNYNLKWKIIALMKHFRRLFASLILYIRDI